MDYSRAPLRMLRMPKALCMTGIVISILVFVLFLADLVIGSVGATKDLAPFKGANRFLDVTFVLCSGALGYLSWATWKEQD